MSIAAVLEISLIIIRKRQTNAIYILDKREKSEAA